jgi:type IV secretory pathway VirB2 component (pilin)
MNLLGEITTVSSTTLPEFVIQIINLIIELSVLLAVVMIIVSGFQYIFSMGDEKKVAKAHKSLIFALIGMILVFIANPVIQFVIDNFLSN